MLPVLKQLTQLAALPLERASAMPSEMYASEEILTLEREKIFSKQWLCAGRVNSIANPGDYLTYSIGEQPIMIVRQKDRSVSAFANVCRHRMMRLLEGRGNCKGNRIMCPYHAWTYSTDGSMIGAPYMQDRPDFDQAKLSLKTVHCEVWKGWIYVTLNPEPLLVAEELKALSTLVSHYHMEDYIDIVSEDHIWNANWKYLTENFMEGYHLPVAHRATVGGHFPVKQTQFSSTPANLAFTYQLFKKTASAPVGIAHPDNKTLKGDQRAISILPTIFPSHMFALAPDHLWYLSLQPKGSNQVSIRYGAALAPEVLASKADPESYIEEVKGFLWQVNEEDRFVVEGIAEGSRGVLSEPGPLSWLERENHEFTQYLARKLCEDDNTCSQ